VVAPNIPNNPPPIIKLRPAATDGPWRALFDWLLSAPDQGAEAPAREQIVQEPADDPEAEASNA